MRRAETLTRRVSAGMVVSGLVVLAILVTALVALRTVHLGSEMAILDLSLDLLEVERLRRSFSDKVASERGLSLTGETLFAERMEEERQRFLTVVERLRPRLSEEPGATLLDEAARAEREHEAAMRRMLQLLREERVAPGEHAPLRIQVSLAREQAEGALEDLARHSEERLVRGVQREVVEDWQALALIMGVSMLGLLGMVGLGWWLSRRVRGLHREVEASEQRFRLLVEGVRDYALFLLDARGSVASWNPGAERITGWKAEEVVGRSAALFYPPEAVAVGEPERDLARAERNGPLRAEGWRVRKEGTRFWAEVSCAALRDEVGELRGFATVTRDITERRQAERTQRLFAEAGRIFNQLQEPGLTVGELTRLMVPELADGCVLFLVCAAGQLLPRAVTHASPDKERLLWELIQRYPSDREAARWVEQVLRSGYSLRVEELTGAELGQVAHDAEHLRLMRALELRSTLVVPLAVGPRRSGVLVLLSSLPERRYTATDQIFVEELAGRAALALDNARLFQETQRALELIGVASHDLGNPLNALQLQLTRLRRVEPEREPERVREGLAAALRHAQRIGQLLHNLLDLSRASSGKLTLEVSRVDLAELVREVVERHAEQAAELGSRIDLEMAPRVEGWWDRLRLERVVTNLLSNALKFGRGRPVEVRLEEQGEQARLRVRDHGVGIPPEAQRRIFERFERERSAGAHAGFGLGLYIVRQLVEAHGGAIQVESAPGEGAAFTVELPRMPPAGVEVGGEVGPEPH